MRADLIVFLFFYIGYILSLCKFCEKYLKGFQINKKNFIILLLVIEAGVNFDGALAAPYILRAMISHILFVGLFLIAFSDDAMKKVFVAMIIVAIKTFVWNFGCSFFSCIVLVGSNLFADRQAAYMDLWLEGIIGVAAYFPVILVQNCLRKRLASVLEPKIRSWYLMTTAFLIGIVAIVDIVNWGASNGIMVVSNASGAAYGDVYYNQIFSHISICLLTALAACMAGGFVFFMNKVYIEQRQKEQYNAQIEFWQMLNEQHIQMERLRHDMKNHVLALYGLWEKKEFDKAGNYLQKMMEKGNIGCEDELTGNKAVDALLYNKRKKAEELSVRWMADIQIPEKCAVDEFDLCVLFGNLLDNAIKACAEMADEKYRFVEIQSQQVKRCLLLVMKNGTALKDTKEIRQGIGFFNVYETIRKYDGTVSIKVENQVFEISVLIPLHDNGYNMKKTV